MTKALSGSSLKNEEQRMLGDIYTAEVIYKQRVTLVEQEDGRLLISGYAGMYFNPDGSPSAHIAKLYGNLQNLRFVRHSQAGEVIEYDVDPVDFNRPIFDDES